jgi:hypothetical protein
MSASRGQHGIGNRTPFLLAAQLGLLLLALPCAVTPTFEGMFSGFDPGVLPGVTRIAMSPSYAIVGGLTVLGMLVAAFLGRTSRLGPPRRADLLAWSAVCVGAFLVVMYLFALWAPMRPL